MQEISNLFQRPYQEVAILYILCVDETDKTEKLINLLLQAAPQRKEEIMSAAQQLVQQGIEKGIQQGIQKGMEEGMKERNVEIAKSMLIKKYPIEEISLLTQLSEEQIKQLEK